MIYKEHEIYARVGGTYSDLYALKDDGSLEDTSEDIIIFNDDEQVVWFEVEVIDPGSGFTTMFTELQTIDDAKKIVDKSVAYCKRMGDYDE